MQRTTNPAEPRGAARSLVLLAAVLALALVAAACTSSEGGDDTSAEAVEVGVNELEPDDPPQPGGRLVFAVTAETNGWNPAAQQWADSGTFIGATMYEPLMDFDADGVAQPFLAQSVVPVDGSDFTQWDVTLNEGITFHDGEPLDAEAAAGSLAFTFADPASLTTTALGSMWQGVEVTGPMTLRVTFVAPWSAFPAVVAGYPGLMMAPSMLAAENVGADAPVGTGPFEFQSWEPGRSLKVVRYVDYWQDGLPYLDEIEFQIIEDNQTRKTELETGGIDIMLANRGADIDGLEAQGFTVVRDYTSEQDSIMLSTAGGPFANEHARLALAYGTDREALVAQLGVAGIQSADNPLMQGTVFEMDDADAGYVAYDPDRAAEELALYTEETGQPLTFTLSGLATVEDQQILQILQEQWRQLGAEVRIDTLEQTAYIGNLVTGAFEAAYYKGNSWIDPDSFYAFWHSSGANGPGQISINFTQWTSPELDAQMDAARETDDTAARAAAYAEAVRVRNAATPELWLFSTPVALVASERVRGLNTFRTEPFAPFSPKPHMAEIWIER